MREQPEQQAPPVQRLRVRYAKRGRMRFTSHRDFSRAFERAVFRARIPMAYSSGFNPHPRISYAGASPTGAASEAEYLELALAETVDPARVHEELDEALPAGLDIVEVVVSSGGTLADRLTGSHWRIRLPGTSADDLHSSVEALLAADQVEVERMTKKGLRRFDVRSAVVSMSAHAAETQTTPDVHDMPGDDVTCAILEVVLRHGTPAVRPDDVLAGLHSIGGLSVPPAALQQRLAQGPLDETGTVGDPLLPDRDAAADTK